MCKSNSGSMIIKSMKKSQKDKPKEWNDPSGYETKRTEKRAISKIQNPFLFWFVG